MIRRIFCALVVCLLLARLGWSMTPEERKDYSKKLVEILTPTRGNAFENWVQQTQPLAPDFDSLPKVPGLPDAFTFADGKRKVLSPQDWQDRRKEIRELFEKYIWGTIPAKPKLDKVVAIDPAVAAAEAAAAAANRGRGRGPATAPDGQARGPAAAPARGGARGAAAAPAPAPGTITKIVDLYYGPNSAIVTRVTVNIPPGPGPFPVLMGGQAGITSRGYIACTAAGNVDGPPDIGKYYPDYDWGSMAKCAWTTQMIVDYLHTLPEVDKRYIAITGYSRGGKYALMCAAIDERITAVVAGSTGVGGVLSWRYGGEANTSESIESTTRMFPVWFPPKFRFFAGHEDRLPVDGNLLVDLVAPRSIVMVYGLNDEVNSAWGNEQTYYDSSKLFKFLGAENRMALVRPPGHHGDSGRGGAEPTARWLDIQFGKSNEKWVNDPFLFPWDYQKWKQASTEKFDLNSYPQHPAGELVDYSNAVVSSSVRWELRGDAIVRAIKGMLGEQPSNSELAKSPVSNQGENGVDDTARWVIGRSIIEHGWTREQAAGITSRSIQFGPGKIRGDFYYKENTPAGTKLPVVIFLHGYSYPLGYMMVYRFDPHPIIALANAGYAVLAFDQSGFGSRMNETASFYDKYPKWSQMGRMVADARAAIDAAEKDEMCIRSKIYLFGYGIGGAVALHTAAVDPRAKGVVSVCGFTPLRTDTPDKGTGGIARLYQERGLMPKLGYFAEDQSRIPYDYDELIGAIVPRTVYIYSPVMDRGATAADVHNAVEAARGVYKLYNSTGKLVLDEPWDYSRLSGPGQERIVDWMNKNMK